jgi:hypothetical protein
MFLPIAVIALVVGAAAAVFITAAVRINMPGNGQHTAGPYIPTTNPFRIGNTVLICEDPARPEMNWFGTVLSTNRGMLTVRDTSAPYSTVDLEKMYAFPAGTNLGW